MRVRMGRKLLADARFVTIILVTILIHFSKNGLIMNSEGHYWAPLLGTARYRTQKQPRSIEKELSAYIFHAILLLVNYIESPDDMQYIYICRNRQ